MAPIMPLEVKIILKLKKGCSGYLGPPAHVRGKKEKNSNHLLPFRLGLFSLGKDILIADKYGCFGKDMQKTLAPKNLCNEICYRISIGI